MKNILKTNVAAILLMLAVPVPKLNAQYALPADFENPQEDTVWNQFANGEGNQENMVLVDNPAADGINTSDYCIRFIVVDDAARWPGAWSDAYGPLHITYENHIMEMMVFKDKISPSGLKVEGGDGYPELIELKASNSVTGEWENLTFDFSAGIGTTYTRLVFFPDFPDGERTSGGICHIDNIAWARPSSANHPPAVPAEEENRVMVYPNPASGQITVQCPGMTRITISNILGQPVSTTEFPVANHRVIDVSGLRAGLYFITLHTADGRISTRFIRK